MTQKAGRVVGHLNTNSLVTAFGESIELVRSAKLDAKFPLYLRTKFGPINFNSAVAQDFLLEHGHIPSKDKPSDVIDPSANPGPIPEVVSDPEPEPKSDKTPGSLGKFLFGDDDE